MRNLLLVLLLLPLLAMGAVPAEKQDLSKINLLQNVGFENGQAKWKKSAGGSWSIATSGSNLLVDKASLVFDAASSGDYVESELYTVPESLKGKPCLASIEQKYADSNLELRVIDNASTVLASVALSTSNKINFLCPSSGSIKLRVHAIGNAAAVALDKAHLGESSELFQVSQASHVGTLKYAATANCSWSNSSATYASFSADSDCPTPTVTGKLTAPATKIPAFKMDVVADSAYRIYCAGVFDQSGATGTYSTRFYDGTDASENAGSNYGSSGLWTGTDGGISAIYSPTTSGLKTIEIQMKVSAGNSYVDASVSDLVCSVEQFPSQSQLALNSVNSNFGWTDGGAVVIEATTSNPTKGTVNTDKIWYKKTGDSGEFRIEYSQTTGGSVGSGDYIFKLPNGLQFDLTKVTAYSTVVGNNTVQAAKNAVGSCMASSLTYATNLVGIAVVYDATHVRCLGADITQNGAIHSGFYQITDNISYAFSFKAPISGWTESQLNMPVLVGGVSSGSSGSLRIESATIANNGTCSIASQSSNWIASVSHVGSGACEINFSSGMFTSAPVCSFNSLGGGSPFIHAGGITSTQIPYAENYRADTDTKPDADFTVMCMGPK